MAESVIQYANVDPKGVVFYGPPKMLRGTLPLVNPTDQKLKMQSLSVTTDTLRGPASLPLQTIAVGVRLMPGEQAAVRSTIQLDPQTAPGTYSFSVDVSGTSVPVTAHVTEVVDFRIEPSTVTLLAGSESSFERTFVIENAGNVPLPLGERCEAPLTDSIDLKTSMLHGLSNAGDAEVKEKVNAWLKDWGERMPGMLVVLRDPIVLSPGNKMTATATFQLPDTLQPFRCYTANLQLYNAFLTITVYTTRNVNASSKKKRGNEDGV